MDLQIMAAQLRKPEGEAGRKVGEIMNKGNILINKWAVEALKLNKGDSVLEIGMGNGAFVKDILNYDASINYTGIDYSTTMVEEARVLNKHWLAAERVSFITGNAAALPFATSAFSRVLTVNTIYFWENPKKQLDEINRVLKEKGRAVFAIRTKQTMEPMPFTQYGFRKFTEEELTSLLEKHFIITECLVRSEPPYNYNGDPILLENAIVVCTKK